MILKEPDDRSSQIEELERLLIDASVATKPKIENTLKKIKAGISGESKTRFFLDDFFRTSENCFVIHDLRIECDGRVAQIDHLLFNRLLDFYVIETKQLHSGLKINDNGEFSRWNKYTKSFDGMPSPLAQNHRHIDVITNLFEHLIEMPTRLGFTLQPRFHSRVLVNPDARIDRPKHFDTSELMKSDEFCNHYMKQYDASNFLETFSSLAKIVTSEQAKTIGMQLVDLHKPLITDYRKLFGLSILDTNKRLNTNLGKSVKTELLTTNKVEQPRSSYSAHNCKRCQSQNLYIEYGKYGYYFKCKTCQGNTAIKITCDDATHKPRLRKEGNQFYKECEACKSRQLFYTNEL